MPGRLSFIFISGTQIASTQLSEILTLTTLVKNSFEELNQFTVMAQLVFTFSRPSLFAILLSIKFN